MSLETRHVALDPGGIRDGRVLPFTFTFHGRTGEAFEAVDGLSPARQKRALNPTLGALPPLLDAR